LQPIVSGNGLIVSCDGC